MPNFLQKTAFKIKLLFTDPRKFWAVIRGLWGHYFGPPSDTTLPRRLSTDLECRVLGEFAAKARLGIIEIGVFDASTTKEFATKTQVPIYGIDPIIPDSMGERNVGNEVHIENNMKFYKDFHFVKDFSYNAVKTWDKPFDFIFIDGDHTYEAVKQDFEDWFPLLAKGGIVAFHDSAPVTSIAAIFDGWPGPIQLVKELRSHAGLEYVSTNDTLTAFRKL